jgi:shikimate kinase
MDQCSARGNRSFPAPNIDSQTPITLMPYPANIVLVGFMGTGKSVVGQRLAARLGRRFLDTDEQIVGMAGRSIPELFQVEGEPGFRERETAVLRSLAGSAGTVIATGGGILGRTENLALLRELGPLVCLTARPEIILSRTQPWESRPMLAGASDPRAAVERLLAERAPLYGQADLVIDTSDRDVDEVVEEICRALK